ncbi:MAG: hypothetical protein E6K65_00280 [Nitrospirae bacterium]|nr:MAG: hypothetical protein E6K65_00280 [Nitrospirota bacterium]
MTAMEFISTLEGVRPRGTGKWSAKCPAHDDTSPSLSVMEGDKGLLVRCFAGCSLTDITQKLGVHVKDLFFDALSADPQQRREAMGQRAQACAVRQAALDAEGRRVDALREADRLIQSARGISIDQWTDHKLHAELDRLGTAYAILDSEGES